MSLGGPHERLRILVMHGDVLLDGGNQFRDIAKYAIAQSLRRDVAEEALDHVEPRCRGRREMNMDTDAWRATL